MKGMSGVKRGGRRMMNGVARRYVGILFLHKTNLNGCFWTS